MLQVLHNFSRIRSFAICLNNSENK